MARFPARGEVGWWARRSPGLVAFPDGQEVELEFHPPSEHWLKGGGGEQAVPPVYGEIKRPDGWSFRLMTMPVYAPETWALFIQPPFHHPTAHLNEFVRKEHGFRRDFPTWEKAMAALRRSAKKPWTALPGGTVSSVRKILVADRKWRGESLSDAELRRELRTLYEISRFPFPPDVALPRGAKHGFSAKQRRDFHEGQWRMGQLGLPLRG